MKKPCSDLNFYLNFIRDNLHHNPPAGDVAEGGGAFPDVFEQNVASVVASISEVAHAKCWQFAKLFQPILSGSSKKLNIEMKNGEKHATIHVNLNRPLYTDMFEVRTGQLGGLPPGFALYQLRRCPSAEEMALTRKMWRGCLDNDDFVSPLKIYPWFAKALLDAVVYLREKEPDWHNVRFRLHAVFPTVHLTIKVSKHTPMYLLSTQPSLRNHSSLRSQQSSRRSHRVRSSYSSRASESRLGSARTTRSSGLTYRSTDTPNSMYNSLKSDDLEAYSLRIPEEEGDEEIIIDPGEAAEGVNEDDPEPITQRDCESRNSRLSALDPRLRFSVLSTDRDTTDTIHLHLVPSVEGFGWPKLARYPQLLPNQRPWSIVTKEWVSELKEHIKDGDSFWGLHAVDPRELKAVYAGRYVPLWRTNYTAANDFMAMKIDQMPISDVLDDICEIFNQMNHGVKSRMWSFVGEKTKQDIKLKAIKTGVHLHKTVPEWFMAVLAIFISHLKGKSAKFQIETGDIDSQSELERLIRFMEEVELICAEEPRKLMEMINVNNGNVLNPSGAVKAPEQQREHMRTSTPLDVPATNNLSSHDEKPVENTKEPGKKPRMLYRLFRKDF